MNELTTQRHKGKRVEFHAPSETTKVISEAEHTYTHTQPDSLENRLLQLCAVWRSIQHHSQAPASPEQRGAYLSTSASTVRRQLAAPDAALAACLTAHQLQAGRADVQDSADVISAVSEPAHLVAHQRTQHSIVVHPTAVRAISTDIIRQTIVQHCRTSDLELTATCRIKLRISIYFQIQT